MLQTGQPVESTSLDISGSMFHLYLGRVLKFVSVGQQPKFGSGRLIVEVSRPHKTHTHTHTWYDSPKPVIGPSQWPLPTQHTSNTRYEHPLSQRDSNLQFQLPSVCGPTPYTARPPGIGTRLKGEAQFTDTLYLQCERTDKYRYDQTASKSSRSNAFHFL